MNILFNKIIKELISIIIMMTLIVSLGIVPVYARAGGYHSSSSSSASSSGTHNRTHRNNPSGYYF